MAVELMAEYHGLKGRESILAELLSAYLDAAVLAPDSDGLSVEDNAALVVGALPDRLAFLEVAVESVAVRRRIAAVEQGLRALVVNDGGDALPYALAVGYTDCDLDELTRLFPVDDLGLRAGSLAMRQNCPVSVRGCHGSPFKQIASDAPAALRGNGPRHAYTLRHLHPGSAIC
ncbi:MAG TPA: hypothetical protein VKA60_23525 [Blastocatellia bacterium]|nr:hypothetical protein [Blastocatellia bacterium]